MRRMVMAEENKDGTLLIKSPLLIKNMADNENAVVNKKYVSSIVGDIESLLIALDTGVGV